MAGPDALDVLAKAGRGWRLPHAAMLLAEGGVPVFPCAPGGKTPITRHGHLDATTDRRQVRAWWRLHPWANIGIPTGAASGLVVVDVDVHGPVDGLRSFVRAGDAGLVKGWGLLVSTPTGGQHAYFPAVPGVEQRSWQVGSAGIDFRGDGGDIIAPTRSSSRVSRFMAMVFERGRLRRRRRRILRDTSGTDPASPSAPTSATSSSSSSSHDPASAALAGSPLPASASHPSRRPTRGRTARSMTRCGWTAWRPTAAMCAGPIDRW